MIRKYDFNNPYCKYKSSESEIVDVKVNSRSARVTPNPIHEVCIRNLGTDDNPCIHIVSDIHLLLHETELSNVVGKDYMEQYVRNMYNTAGVSLPANANFQQIARGIKSRYIQSPQELKSWIASLDADMQQIYSDSVDKVSAAKEAAEAAAEPASASAE